MLDASKYRNSRAWEDEQHLAECLKSHPGSAFSHKGFMQWQGSEAQELAKKDIAENLHITIGKQGLYGLQPDYYENFPLKDFRDKIYQEVGACAAKKYYNVKGKCHKAN
jgi:hypothetical protein